MHACCCHCSCTPSIFYFFSSYFTFFYLFIFDIPHFVIFFLLAWLERNGSFHFQYFLLFHLYPRRKLVEMIMSVRFGVLFFTSPLSLFISPLLLSYFYYLDIPEWKRGGKARARYHFCFLGILFWAHKG